VSFIWEIKKTKKKTLNLNSKLANFKILGKRGLHLKKSIVICNYPKWSEGRGKL
tara:strand:- start:128 stop:289 length:162 start_codon:yes stop_codon:yes gene_type:complete